MAAPSPAQSSSGVVRSAAPSQIDRAAPRGSNWPQPSAAPDGVGSFDTPRPVSIGGVMERALSTLDLPAPMELVAALRETAKRVELAERAAPGLSKLVSLVINEEIARLDRYLDMRGQ